MNHKKQTGKVNYIWVIAGGYLIYLATKIFREVFAGNSNNAAIGIGGGVLFVVIGVLLLVREWRAYKYGLEHIDDPDSWSEDENLSEDEELAQLMESSKQDAIEKLTEEEEIQEDVE